MIQNPIKITEEDSPILFLEPVYKEMLWGGERLRTDFGFPIPSSHTGECWTVSAYENSACKVAEGIFAGKTLSDLWDEQPGLFGNIGGRRFPLLVKIIDAASDLSIQVHPDDQYACEHENGAMGKSECWFVLDCPEDATLVLGHNAATKSELQSMITDGRWEELIREVPIHKGEFIQVHPGTVHSIRKGTLILEIQQNSDITYRVYDYDRLTDGHPRELHIKESLDCIMVPAEEIRYLKRDTTGFPVNSMNELITCDKYKVWKLDVREHMSIGRDTLCRYPFLIVGVLGGSGRINAHPIAKGDHFILPFGFEKADLYGNMELILCTV